MGLKKIDKLLNHFYTKRRFSFLVFFSLPVIVWQWPLIATTDQLLSGDFDYFTQAYEAVRISILKYHQFPWINSWIGGGVPLYGNPQIGVVSIQTLLVLLLGAPFGLKISVIIYSLIGFWGMFYLLKNNFKINYTLALPLSSVWITNGFFISHLVDHYSFSMFLVLPALLYFLVNISRRHYWIYFGLSLGLFMLSAFHYAAFHGLLIIGSASVFILLRNWRNYKKYLLLYLKAGILFLVIAGHRIVYTVQFALDFPRAFVDLPNHPITAIKSFLIPVAVNDSRFYDNIIWPENINYGWGEHSVFIGYILSGILLILILYCLYLFIRYCYSYKLNVTNAYKQHQMLFVAFGLSLLFVLFIIISLGNFSPFSPYGLLQHLPAYSGMRVSSRWLIWAVLFGLIFVGVMTQLVKSPRIRSILTILVILGAGEVYLVGMANDKFFYRPLVFRSENATFEQFEDFDRYNPPKDFNTYKTRSDYDRRFEIYSYEATLNNLGQARGYEPLVDTYYAPTMRCGIVQKCSFIKTNNAKLIYWSPNKIVLHRTAKGSIELNMNPSNYWLVNGKPAFPTARTVEVLQPFIITDSSNTITLSVKPYGVSRFVTAGKNRLISQ